MILYEVLKITVIQSDIRAHRESVTEHQCAALPASLGLESNTIWKVHGQISGTVVAKWL